MQYLGHRAKYSHTGLKLLKMVLLFVSSLSFLITPPVGKTQFPPLVVLLTPQVSIKTVRRLVNDALRIIFFLSSCRDVLYKTQSYLITTLLLPNYKNKHYTIQIMAIYGNFE